MYGCASMVRSVAQSGRALPSGGRGRRFKSSRSDQFRSEDMWESEKIWGIINESQEENFGK